MNGRSEVEALIDFFHMPHLMIDVNGAMTEIQTPEKTIAFNIRRRDLFRPGDAIHRPQFVS